MNPTLKTNEKGLVKTSDYTAVNPLYATPQALSQAYKIQNQTISSDLLSNNQKPLSLPETTQNTVQTTGASIQGLTEGLNQSSLATIQQEQDLKAQQAKAQADSATSKVQGLIDKFMGKGQAQVQAEEQAGISQKTQELTNITNEYNTKALEYRRMEEAVMKESMLTDVQKNARLRQISREKNTELADIGIKQAVAQNNLKTAQDLVDRKIDLEYGDLKDIIGFQQEFLKMNREDLSKAEQNAFNLKITENTRKYEEGKSIGEFAKQVAANGADAGTISRVSSAKTMAEAIQAAGQFAGDVLERQKKQLEIQKLSKEIAGLSGGVNVDVSKLSPRGQQLIANVKNLRFSNVEESKRIISNIATRLANGDEQGAVDDLKDFAYQKMSMGQKTDYDNYEGAISSFESAANQINTQNITTGPYKALAEKAKPYASIKNDKAYTDLRSVIELGQAQLRKGFYGTAVTGTEAANARNFLIQDSDPINVISWKLENGSNFLKFTNDAAVARQVGLDKPNLDDYLTYRVREKSTGQIGTLPRSEYDPNVYEIVNQ